MVGWIRKAVGDVVVGFEGGGWGSLRKPTRGFIAKAQVSYPQHLHAFPTAF